MKKLTILCWLLGALSSNVVAQKTYNEKVADYIQRHKDWAMSEQLRTGVPAAITLAQGIYETGAGESDLCTKANNHFGIKCKSTWTGATFHKDDDAPDECFRSYTNAWQSYQDHSDFLKNNTRYASLFQYSYTDYKKWCHGLRQCGYATNPQYGHRLIKIIEENNLNDYSVMAARQAGNEIVPGDAPTTPLLYASYTPTGAEDYKVVTINNMKAVYCRRGTPLLDIAMAFDIRYSKLLEMNDLPDAPVPFDMYIYLQRKPTKALNPTHTVKPGETMLYIAQSEGVQLQSILEYNNMTNQEQPVTGSTIYLQEPSNIKPVIVSVPTMTKQAIITSNTQNDEYVVVNNNTEQVTTTVSSPKNYQTEVVDQPILMREEVVSAPVQTAQTEVITIAEATRAEVVSNPTSIAKTAIIEEEPVDDFSRLKRKLDKIVYADKTKPATGSSVNKAAATAGEAAATVPSQAAEAPNPTAPPATPKAATSKYYMVKKGDTAYGIAKKNGITMKQLMDWNKLDFNQIQVGQKLQVQP